MVPVRINQPDGTVGQDFPAAGPSSEDGEVSSAPHRRVSIFIIEFQRWRCSYCSTAMEGAGRVDGDSVRRPADVPLATDFTRSRSGREDMIAPARHEFRGVAAVDDEIGMIGDHLPVERRVICGDEHTVVFLQSLLR